MEKLYYPAVFHTAEEGGYYVDFPDLLGCVTEGDTLTEAVAMAEDALGLYLSTLEEDKKELPVPSIPSDIQTGGKDFVSLIEWDRLEYMRRTNTKAVKKTVTIPEWMDIMGRERNVNFSNILQNGLRAEFGM